MNSNILVTILAFGLACTYATDIETSNPFLAQLYVPDVSHYFLSILSQIYEERSYRLVNPGDYFLTVLATFLSSVELKVKFLQSGNSMRFI